MTNLVAARAEIATVLATAKAAWTDYPLVIEQDNSDEVNESTQQDPYLMVTIKNMKGDQLDLGTDPFSEQRGQILLTACTRAGGGTADGLKLLDFLGRYFAMKDFTTVRCHTAQAVGGSVIRGWWRESMIIDYWYIWRKSE